MSASRKNFRIPDGEFEERGGAGGNFFSSRFGLSRALPFGTADFADKKKKENHNRRNNKSIHSFVVAPPTGRSALLLKPGSLITISLKEERRRRRKRIWDLPGSTSWESQRSRERTTIGNNSRKERKKSFLLVWAPPLLPSSCGYDSDYGICLPKKKIKKIKLSLLPSLKRIIKSTAHVISPKLWLDVCRQASKKNLSFFSFFFFFQISVMSKLVPSPDWFVGLDSLDLCENGRFVDLLTVEVKKERKTTYSTLQSAKNKATKDSFTLNNIYIT